MKQQKPIKYAVADYSNGNPLYVVRSVRNRIEYRFDSEEMAAALALRLGAAVQDYKE